MFLFFLQVYSQQRETVQVHRVRQGILSEQDAGCPQDFAHGGIAAQVPRLRQEFQSEEQPQDPSSHSHGH